MKINHIITQGAIAVAMAACASPAVWGQDKLFPNEFPLRDVELLDGPLRHARDLNMDLLTQYEIDRLLAPFLKEAGLEPKAPSFPCWDGLDGHVGGHYLTALAINYAATGDKRMKERMDYFLSELDRAQRANGNGYVGGVPDGKAMWEDIRKGKVDQVWKRWVPWYNLHKTYAGLRDAWLYGDSDDARRMFLELCDWGVELIKNLDDKQMESMLNCEFGGMNEVYADAYAMTGDRRYLDAARKFTHHRLFDSMARGVDNLDNMHANTQVPKAVGFQRVAEVSGDTAYYNAAGFFWHRVADTRSLSIGGNSRREHFPSAADCVSYTEEREGPETCNTNNMLKLTEGLFRMKPDARYADFFERATFNHILSSQHPAHGGYVYFTPARPAHYRVYSTPNNGMWCCVGTGMENHGKYGQFVYTHSGDTLSVNLFVPTRLNWREKGLKLTQETDFPVSGRSRLTVTASKKQPLTMMVRYPSWAEGMTVRVNGKPYAFDAAPGSYIPISRKWKKGDVVELDMPMNVSVEEMPNVPNYISILRGPIVLAQRMGTDRLDGLMADDSRMGHVAHGPQVSVYDTPIIIGSRQEVLEKIKGLRAVPGKEQTYTVPGLFAEAVELEPFARVHDCRYMLYWLNLTADEYAATAARLKAEEAERLALDARTVDAVNTGEQQPEADHFMDAAKSNTGYSKDRPWRDADDGGHITYRLKPAGLDSLSLMVTYWGNEKGKRTFDILIDDTVIATENLSGKWNEDRFVDVSYAIPASLLTGRESVALTFRPHAGNRAGAIFNIRLLK